jgi:hypothetical protein
MIALCALPASTLTAQRLTNERAGIATGAAVGATVPSDTPSRDSISHGLSRRGHILIGAVSGLATGAVVGTVVTSRARSRCSTSDDLCGAFDGLVVLGDAVIGLLVGTAIGALWPTH